MTRCRFTYSADGANRRRAANGKGYTLTEVMISLAIIGLIIPILSVVFNSGSKTFTAFEAMNQLKQANQNTVNRIYLRLGRTKRLFQNTSLDADFLGRVSLSGCPARAAGYQLPAIEPNGSLAPGTTAFHSASFGNSLFFAYNTESQILENIADSPSSTTTVRIDVYKFAHYYLSQDNAPSIVGKQTYKLIEWESNKYADCMQVRNISNATKKYSTVAALVSAGVEHCWEPSATDIAVAFSTFTVIAGSGTVTLEPAHILAPGKYKTLTSITTGIMGGGYRYGISPNTSGWDTILKTVPLYATPSGNFPSGFEVGITGASAARKVLVRTVIVAQGSMSKMVADEQTIVVAARDIW